MKFQFRQFDATRSASSQFSKTASAVLFFKFRKTLRPSNFVEQYGKLCNLGANGRRKGE